MGANGGERGEAFVPSSGEELESPSHMKPECCIFKVHHYFGEIKAKAYKPQIVAIGPYHHCSRSSKKNSSPEEEEERKVNNFSMMEEHKWRYLNKMLERKGVDFDFLKQAMRVNIARVRSYYAEPLGCFSDDELSKMMVLDGCFIIELLRKRYMRHLQDPDDPIFKIDWILKSLQRDLLLFENQLPFFVLHQLFGMIERPNDARLVELVLKFFIDVLPDPRLRLWEPCEYSLGDIRHLLELIHLNWHSEIFWMDGGKSNRVLDLFPQRRRYIRCATELREAGVKFEKIDGASLIDIRFRKGTLQIPFIVIDNRTESFWRNMLAYEQYWIQQWEDRRRFVTGYVCFLDRLIDSPKDVEILCRRGIIHNLLGDDEAVCDIFNKISDSVMPGNEYSFYYPIEEEVNIHCEKRRNRWMAMLRHNHFNSPWGILSVAAGLVLLILTFTQTIFSVFPRK